NFEKSQLMRFLYDDSDSEFEEELDDKPLTPLALRGENLFLESISNNKRLIGTILLPEIELKMGRIKDVLSMKWNPVPRLC
ncbi:13528_t:CDS:2, partial [Gigaspora rosea]